MNPGSPCFTSELDSSDDGLPDQRSRWTVQFGAQHDILWANGLIGPAAAEFSAIIEQIGLSHAVCRARGGP